MILDRNKIIELVATVLGLAINSVTMVTLCSWAKRKLTNRARLLVSIAAANLVAAVGMVITLLITIYRPAMNMFCSNWADVLVEDVRISGTILIMLGLCSLSLDLYLTVNYSMHYQVYSRRISSFTVAGTWILGIFLGFVSAFVNLASQGDKTEATPTLCHTQKHGAMFTIPTLPPVPVEFHQRLTRLKARTLSPPKYWALLTVPPLTPVPLHSTEIPPTQLQTKHVSEQTTKNVTMMHLSRYFGYATQTVVTAVGLVVICTFLALILRRILRPTCGQRRATASRRRGACTILILLLAFVLTMLPGLLTELYMFVQVMLHTSSEIFQNEVSYFVWVQPYLQSLTISYTVVSPIILYTRMREVRNSYRHVLFGFQQKFNRSSAAEAAGTAAGDTIGLSNMAMAVQLLASSTSAASWRHRQLRQNDFDEESDESNNSNLRVLNLERVIPSPSDNWAENDEDVRHLITQSTHL